MAKTYWIMKNPGSTAEWIEMNGKQFYEFIKSPAGKNRYFMDCDIYKIEVSSEQYRKWKLETNHHNYLQGFENEALIIPLGILADENNISEDDVVADSSVNIEDEVINNIELQRLSEAILSLTDDERWLINELFMGDKPKTEREITESTGIPQQTISYRKNKILKKIKFFLVKS